MKTAIHYFKVQPSIQCNIFLSLDEVSWI